MTMENNYIKKYLKTVEEDLSRGISTEHTFRPALKELIESLLAGVTATNEPKRVACGAPDFIISKGHVPLGYIEAKDIGKSLDEVERSEQMARYFKGLGNLILTDYLEFRWYADSEKRLTIRLASIGVKGNLHVESESVSGLIKLFEAFLINQTPTVGTPKELAVRMASFAHIIRDTIEKTFDSEDGGGTLHQQMEGFQKVLLHDLTKEQFADMYAQTICYGLFAARCNLSAGEKFTREHAAFDLPKTNPFLRKMFGHIAGPDLDDRIIWIVDDLAKLLARADIEAVLKNFGKRTKQEDPVVHFYETFLSAYDPKLREARGVYYTPEPVVSYIVRSVDRILKNDFKLKDGLADTSTVKVSSPSKKEKTEYHKVLILDPAAGTGTFLHGVIDQIYENFKFNKGMWSGYVSEHLLPRLFGFEILMAPYAVAHMKLGLQFAELGYDFQVNERLRVYLTNTLEEAHKMTGLPLFTQWLAEEANAAGQVKQDAPVMVVLGNPPYSYKSKNTGEWISALIQDYYKVNGEPLGEKNPKGLQDDYVKFIRFAQWRIEKTGYGILSFITNHGYLDNPTFRGMRKSLLDTFNDIYILDLHGNSKKKEKCPDGSLDKNVFDIQQGVAIGIFVKKPVGSSKSINKVRHAESWGLRENKYKWLSENEISTTEWATLNPQSPEYLFLPQNTELMPEYELGWKIIDFMTANSVGIVTSRDKLAVHFTKEMAKETIAEFVNLPIEAARKKFDLGEDSQDWQVALAQADLRQSEIDLDNPIAMAYRPFDARFTYYTGHSKGFHSRPRPDVMNQMFFDNVALLTSRLTKGEQFAHVFVTRHISEKILLSAKTSNNSYHFPLYIYPQTNIEKTAGIARRPNLTTKFIKDFSSRLGMQFVFSGRGDKVKTFGPEDIFDYMYAVFHSPGYRSRYSEFLKRDFPRLPLTSSIALFSKLCELGNELVNLHLMEKQISYITNYPITGDNMVENVEYSESGGGTSKGCVWINKAQYFEGIPLEVWSFHVGGYQVCQKWLKDRKGRKLTYDELTHYQQVVAILAKTIQSMHESDKAIEEHGGWPIK